MSLEEQVSNHDELIMRRTSELEAELEKYQGQIEAEIAQNNRNNDWMEKSVKKLSHLVNSTQTKTQRLQSEIHHSNTNLEKERLRIIEIRTSQSALEKDLEKENSRLDSVKLQVQKELQRQREQQQELKAEFASIQAQQEQQNPAAMLIALQTILGANITKGLF